jgi:hypothetical protein
MAFQGRDLFAAVATRHDENRRDELARVQPRLADQFAQLRIGSQAARAVARGSRDRPGSKELTHLS